MHPETCWIYLSLEQDSSLNDEQPWVLIKNSDNIQRVKFVIYNVLESSRIIGQLLKPILPNLSNKIDDQLGLVYLENLTWTEQLNWGHLKKGTNLPKPNPIIEKLNYE